MKISKSIVLDSWALLAYFQDESSGEKVAELIADASQDGTRLLMSVVNVGEIWYTLARRRSVKDADESVEELRSIGIHFVEADWNLARIAASYKAKGGISYADCYAAALTKQQNATLLTGDPEFKQFEKELTIQWLSNE